MNMAETGGFLALRTCLLSPLPEHEAAAEMLSGAADAILAGDLNLARDLVRRADMPELFEFARRLMGPEDTEVHRRRPVSKPAAVVIKASSRMPTSTEIKALYVRDGWRCRFCGCQVVSNRARSVMRACIPGAIPWTESEGYHGAFFALTASVDHVLPHSAGGGNELQNLVTACWSCQFGRGAYTIEELGLTDPRSRPPVIDGWDGLSRVIGRASAATPLQAAVVEAPTLFASPEEVASAGPEQAATHRAFSSSEAAWLSRLDGNQSTPSRRLIDFLDSCVDIDVSWTLNKVLLARMKVDGNTIEFMAVEPNGDVHIPWSIGGSKELFRGFADKLAEGISGAVAHETPKLWNVAKADKKFLNVLKLLDNSAAVRTALETLNVAMKDSFETSQAAQASIIHE